MNLRVRDFLLGAVFVAFLISNFVLIRSNLRLRDELIVANMSIAKLQRNLFHDGVISDPSAPPELVLYNYSQAVQTNSGNNQLRVNKDPTPGMSLLDLKSEYLGKEAQSRFTLFVFFSPTDCNSCLQESATWEKLYGDSQRLSLCVMGIMDHPDRTEAERFLKQLGVTFPVLSDNTAFLRSKYRINETPEKVLVDYQGKTLLISPGSKTADDRQAFEESVMGLITQ